MLIHKPTEAMQTQPGLEVHALEADQDAAIEAFRSRIYSRSDTWVQELLSNARDAVRERRKAEPDAELGIRITFDLDRHEASVEDDGLGMSQTLLMDVFRVLGRSTRRGSDDYTGAWGIGSKAPLKIADSFIVETRSKQDGMLHEVLVGRFEQGGQPHWGFTFLHHEASSGPWGTRITVPVPAAIFDACIQRARTTCRFWSDRVTLQLVEGGQVQSSALGGEDVHQDGRLRVDEGDFSASFADGKRRYRGMQLLVLVDDIPYGEPVEDHPCLRIRVKRPSLVDLTSGRENLDMTAKTNGLVARAATAVQEAAESEIKSLLDTLTAAVPEERLGLISRIDDLGKLHLDCGSPGGTRSSPGPELHPLLTRMPAWAIWEHQLSGRRRHCFSDKAVYQTIRRSPTFFGKRVPLQALAERLAGATEEHPSVAHFILMPDEPGPVHDALVAAGAQHLPFVPKVRDFRVTLGQPGGGTIECTDPSSIPKHRPVVLAANLADLQGLEPTWATYILRTSQRARNTLTALGHDVLDVAGFVQRQQQVQVATSRGPMTLSRIGADATWLHGIPASLVRQLRGDELLVAANREWEAFWTRISGGRPTYTLPPLTHVPSGKPWLEHLDSVQPGLSWMVEDIQRTSGGGRQDQFAALVDRLLREPACSI